MTEQNTSFVKRHAKKLFLLGILVLLILLYFLNPKVNSVMKEIFRRFATGDFYEVANFIDQYGPYAMAISALLIVLQAVMAPLPAFLITFANANLFGW